MKALRLTLPAIALALLAPVPATAAGEEIELRIEALGDAQPRTAKVVFEIQASDESPAAAERGLAAAKADLTRKFGEIGIKPQQITFSDMDADRYPYPVAVAITPVAPPAPPAPPPAPEAKPRAPQPVAVAPAPPPPVVKPLPQPPRPKEYRRSTVTIALDDLGKLEAVRSRSRDFSRSGYSSPSVIYAQRDPAAARDEAVAKAIAQARIEADRYAAAMGYKVVRIARVSNAKPTLNMPDLFQFIGTVDRRTGDSERLMATVWAGVAIDFVIAPK